ncbi:MAG: hypothetical protein Q9198_000335, partial [Flavoplaca austrocitrina]
MLTMTMPTSDGFGLPLPVVIAAFLTLTWLTSLISTRRRIGRLGSFAPRVPSYLPFGLDIVLRSALYSSNNNDLDFWAWLYSHSLHKGSPTVELYLGTQRFVFTADPENIKAILATKFQDYGKGQSFHEDWKDFLGDGIFNVDGEKWQASRHLIRPQFSQERLHDLDILENHVQKAIAKVDGHGQEVDVADLFYRLTLDATTDFLLAHSVGSLDDPQTEFAAAFNEIQRVQALKMRLGPLSPLAVGSSFWHALRVLDSFVEPFVKSALQLKSSESEEASKPSFLQALSIAGVGDKQLIRDQCVNILLAGRDTTAGTLSFLFLELSRRPKVVSKVRREIMQTIGSEARPSYKDLRNLTYLKNTINETLRLYPAIPFNVRWSLRDTTLPRGGGQDGTEPIGIEKDTAYTTVRILQQFEKLECYSSTNETKLKSEIVLSPVQGVK